MRGPALFPVYVGPIPRSYMGPPVRLRDKVLLRFHAHGFCHARGCWRPGVEWRLEGHLVRHVEMSHQPAAPLSDAQAESLRESAGRSSCCKWE